MQDLQELASLNRFYYFTEPQEGKVFDFLHNPEQCPTIIGASSVANCLGVGYETPMKQWRIQSGIEKQVESEYKTYIFKRGKEGEPIGVDDFLEHFPQFLAITPGPVFHPDFHNLFATTDRILYHQETKELWNMEVKCPQSDISNILDDQKYLTRSKNKVKYQVATGIYKVYKYIIQATLQMKVLKIPRTLILIYTPEQTKVFYLEFKPDLHDLIVSLMKVFINSIKVGLTPQSNNPDPRLLEELEKARKSLVLWN
jgi:hypothetical protein